MHSDCGAIAEAWGYGCGEKANDEIVGFSWNPSCEIGAGRFSELMQNVRERIPVGKELFP